MADTIDLYDDRGKKLKSDVDLQAINPLKNSAILGMVNTVKRTVAVNLAGIEKACKNASYGGQSRNIPGREVDIDPTAKADKIAARVKELIQVEKGDDTEVAVLGGGKFLRVAAPTRRIEAGAEYVAGMTCTAAALTEAMREEYGLGMYDTPYVKNAIWGTYPQTMDMKGGNVLSVLGIPQNDEGLGFALRNIMANHLAMLSQRNAMNCAAISSILEHCGVFEMGQAIGLFERYQLLALAYQGLNANNMVYDMVKANGKTGTVGTVVQETVGRALDDGVISVDKTMPSGYKVYKANDVCMWNAYCAAGTMAATMVNCGALRGAQAVSSTLLYFNDMIEKETSLPGCDWGRVEGTAVGFSFFSHSIYGGGGPGVFNGNHVVTRHSTGMAIPCVAVAVALDAGTQMFSPESTSAIVLDTFQDVPIMMNPLKEVAAAV
ncbi:MAG: coenzyme-B sulfoethylthiotransferase subunit beta [Euryarchaeota archaeon]|nr:coenzyme-B sulfoethylthiotransferase subunit beta [Euryarchaeota archaeon]